MTLKGLNLGCRILGKLFELSENHFSGVSMRESELAHVSA